MIKYILIIISMVLILLFTYIQLNKSSPLNKNLNNKYINSTKNGKISLSQALRQTQAKNNHQNIATINTIPNNLNKGVNAFDKEMAKNEKEIIKEFLNITETLSRTYNLDEEENIPTELPNSQNVEEYRDISLEELDKIEKKNNLQPIVIYKPNIQETPQDNISITKDELEDAEINAGMQEILEDNSESLDEQDIPF